MAQTIVNHGVEGVRKIATTLNKSEYLRYLEVLLPQLSPVAKTYFILWDWMEDNSLDVSAEARLEHYIQIAMADSESGSPARNCLTNRELLHVAEEVADKVVHLAAVLGEDKRLRTTNEKDMVLKTYHLLVGWEEDQHDGVNTRHQLAHALQEIGKTKMADRYIAMCVHHSPQNFMTLFFSVPTRLRHGTFSPVHQVPHISRTQFPYQVANDHNYVTAAMHKLKHINFLSTLLPNFDCYCNNFQWLQDAVLFTGARLVKEEQVLLLASALMVGDAELSSLQSDFQARPAGLVNALFQRWWAREKRDFKEFLALLRNAGFLEATKRFECKWDQSCVKCQMVVSECTLTRNIQLIVQTRMGDLPWQVPIIHFKKKKTLWGSYTIWHYVRWSIFEDGIMQSANSAMISQLLTSDMP